MKKIVKVDYRAEKELVAFSDEVRSEFRAHFRTLELNGRLEFPEARKLDSNLHEIRINVEGAYRGFYAYVDKEVVIILHLFRKKVQKTPIKNLKLAKRRLNNYEY